MTTLNLDRQAAYYAQQMVANAAQRSETGSVETLERLVTKTLGVLQEQGVYAAMLFLYSRTEKEKNLAVVIRQQLFRLLKDTDQNYCLPAFANTSVPQDGAEANEALSFYTQYVLNDLSLLLLVRDLYEQTLIYARYGAKAEG